MGIDFPVISPFLLKGESDSIITNSLQGRQGNGTI